MDRPRTTPKDFFLWAGAMITLYGSAVAAISLIFDYLNYAYPDPLAYFASNPYQGGISYEMATLIVLFPLCIFLSHLIITDIKNDPSRSEIWVRRWALYLTLFVAGATVAGDLITLIMYFFNGDVTLRFVLKVAVLFLIMLGIFLHYLADLRGYWTNEPVRARVVRWASLVLVAATIIAGFFIVGTPWQQRLYAYDGQKVNDLQQIEMQIVSYWQGRGQLPASLNMLNDAISGYQTPADPQSNNSYEYHLMGGVTFQLCAVFNEPSRPGQIPNIHQPMMPYPASIGQNLDNNWPHDAGHVCFLRTIDPNRYPVNTVKPAPTP